MLNTSPGMPSGTRPRPATHINVALVNEAISEFHLVVSAVRNTELFLNFTISPAEVANVDFEKLGPALRLKLETIKASLSGISSVSVGQAV